jgi:hypothetical protein
MHPCLVMINDIATVMQGAMVLCMKTEVSKSSWTVQLTTGICTTQVVQDRPTIVVRQHRSDLHAAVMVSVSLNGI